MGKAIRTLISPKLYKEKFTYQIDNPKWEENELIDWIKNSALGDVWFDYYVVHDRNRQYRHHVIHVWFQQRKDAMLFKLECIK